jgi:hypothetical protein
MASASGERSFLSYLKAAFLLPWNTMVFGGAVLGAAFSPDPAAFMAMVMAVEGLYLAGLTAHPRFRTAIDAQGRGESTGETPTTADESWRAMLATLPPAALARFDRLRTRCREMRHLARAVQRADESTADVVGSLRTTGLDQLLWGFLRLLQHHAALERLLAELSRTDLAERVRSVQADLARATEAKDERLMRSYQERLTTTQTRLDYYDRTARDAEFLRVELDRVEEKILALSEMAVNQHDADVLSAEIDAAASSMQATETSLSALGIGMTPAIPGTTPAILDAVDPEIEEGPRAAAARAAARARQRSVDR